MHISEKEPLLVANKENLLMNVNSATNSNMHGRFELYRDFIDGQGTELSSIHFYACVTPTTSKLQLNNKGRNPFRDNASCHVN